MIYSTYILISFVGILSTLFILSSLNPISRLALLIVVFLMSAFQYLILDYYFLGLTYIIVYVGAIAVLFLFVIMLIQTNLQVNSDSYRSIEPDKMEIDGKIILNKSIYVAKSSIKEVKVNFKKDPNRNLSWINYGFITLFCLFIFYINRSMLLESLSMVSFNYIYPSWTKEIYTLTDIETLGYSVYLGYPVGIVLLGVLLWIVLIGVLCIST